MIRPLIGLLLAASTACFATVGCAADSEGDDDHVDIGDGANPDDEVVAERQLGGNDMPNKTISLTFDDGPGRRTSELSEFLADNGIPGTFFINGKNAPNRMSSLENIVSHGHLLANHTQNHKSLTGLGAGAIVDEVARTDAFIAQVQPEGPWVIRAPYGAWNGNVARAINGSSMKKYVGSVFWNQGGELTANTAADWDCWGKGVSVQRCGELYLKEIRAKGKGIVLMHDIHDKTVDMVKSVIVPALRAEGWNFVRVDQAPSVQRALGLANGPQPTDSQCSSATLGRNVDENVCVQARSDEKWYRCVSGEWAASSSGDRSCTQRIGL